MRPYKELTKHFTTRTADSRAIPEKSVINLPKLNYWFKIYIKDLIYQKLVKFCAEYRIKQHAPPLVLAPVSSFEF